MHRNLLCKIINCFKHGWSASGDASRVWFLHQRRTMHNLYIYIYIEDNKTQFKFCASSHRLICCR